MREKIKNNFNTLLLVTGVFIGLIIIIEIFTFIFWSTIYPDPGNGSEVLAASIYTTRCISCFVALIMVIILILRYLNLIKVKSIAIFAISILIFISALLFMAKQMLNANKISENDLTNVVIWPDKMSIK